MTVMLGLSAPVPAGLDVHVVGGGAGWCFGSAMVGFDSVINSRLGVPAEHALDMAAPSAGAGAAAGNRLSTPLLTVILDAYLWEGSPHDYAVNVFYSCAQQQTPIIGAGM